MHSTPSTDENNLRQRRGFWLRTLHQWHWISSAVCLVGMLLFAITGITLNHASQIPATPTVVSDTARLPESMRDALQRQAEGEIDAPLPAELGDWLATHTGLQVGARAAEWSTDEIYLSMPRAGGDGWLAIDLASGELEFETTDRGWISYFNDLHKGRNTGAAWRWFIDIFALACLVFCITGLCLLQMHARQRGMTWPVVGLGLLVPLLIIVLLVH